MLPRAPFFEDLHRGQVFDNAPGVTLTSGRAAVHQALTGGRFRLALDNAVATRVAGGPVADPTLVWDTAIGQSTVVTERVVANLFYRGLVFHRAPLIDDTLNTTTEVVALKQNKSPTGLALLRIVTVDQRDRTVLDFLRCALLPLRSASSRTQHSDDVTQAQVPEPPAGPITALVPWRRDALIPRSEMRELEVGERRALGEFEVVDAAPSLARSSVNVAAAHLRVDHERPRLVYGGHTIALAAGQLARLFPECVYIVAWRSCEHLAPVREADGLRTRITVDGLTAGASGWNLVELRCVVERAVAGGAPEPVLDWRPVAVFP